MKKNISLIVVLLSMMVLTESLAAQTLFKKRKYYGPIPINNINLSIGFVDGPNADYLTEHLSDWAKERQGEDIFTHVSTSPFGRVGFQRRITPNSYLNSAVSLSYLKAESQGNYYTLTSPILNLDMERSLKIYLFSLDLGIAYFMVPPKARQLSPYFGGGFSCVLPLARLETHRVQSNGLPFDPTDTTTSRNSFEAGVHAEFGMIYHLTNKYGAGLEGRYHISQSKFYIHGGNFDISYEGFTLSLNAYYYF
ncbi:MAG: outer membrane beta-barrel protein [Candidatus Krumholzibacteriota bacterium]|nr:outer membrane beta-barrel protein [Candidatus Krumholzibacteriota bacterium]